MRLSTRGKYALEALLFLGHGNKREKLISLNTISGETGISAGYLEQLFRPLKKNGIIKSIKGKYGGYRLAIPADKITVGDILLCAEGPLSLVKCAESDSCTRKERCPTHRVWEVAYKKTSQTINSITLNDLICDYDARLKKAGSS